MAIRWHRPAAVRGRAWLDTYQVGSNGHEPQFVHPWTIPHLRFWLKRYAYLEKQNSSGLSVKQWAYRLARRYGTGLPDAAIDRVARGVERQAEYYCTRTLSPRFRKRQTRKGHLGGLASDSRPGGLARAAALRELNRPRDREIRRAMWRRDNQRRRGERRTPVRAIADAHGVSRALCYYLTRRHLRLERPESRTCPKCHGRGVIVDLRTNSARLCSCRRRPPAQPASESAPRRSDLERLDVGSALPQFPSLFASAAAVAAASGSGASEMDLRRSGPCVDEEFPFPDSPDAVGVRPEVAAGIAGDLPSSGRGARKGRDPERGLHADIWASPTRQEAPKQPSRGPPQPAQASNLPSIRHADPLADCETGEVCPKCRGLGFTGPRGAFEACGCNAGVQWEALRHRRDRLR